MVVTATDAAAVGATARLHLAHLELGLFPQLGPRFLGRYHETFVRSPFGVLLIAYEGGEVAGFLAGTTANADHYRWVVRNCGPRLAATASAALLARPRLLPVVLRTRGPRYARAVARRLRPARSRPATGAGGPAAAGPTAPGGAGTPAASPGTDATAPAPGTDTPAAAAGAGAGAQLEGPPVGVLTHVATSDAYRGAGIGRTLVERYVDEARAAGSRELRLLTTQGSPAAAFYERLGWQHLCDRAARDGAAVHEYRLCLTDGPEPDR